MLAETSKYASEKANDAADTTSEKISGTKIYASKEGQEINMASDMAESGRDKAHDTYEFASDKVSEAMDKVSDMAYNAKDTIKEKAEEAYDTALKKGHNMMYKASEMGNDAYDKGGQSMNKVQTWQAMPRRVLKRQWEMQYPVAKTAVLIGTRMPNQKHMILTCLQRIP